MPVFRTGVRKLRIDCITNNLKKFDNFNIFAFCHEKTDWIMMYNDKYITLHKRIQDENNTKQFIEINIQELNWPKNVINWFIFHPRIHFSKGILFSLCTITCNNQCIILLKNLINDKNALFKPWQIKYLYNDKNEPLTHINVCALTLCIAEVKEDEIHFIAIYYDNIKKYHEMYKLNCILASNKQICNRINNYEAKNIFNKEDINDSILMSKNAYLINIYKLNYYLLITGGSRTIYKLCKQNVNNVEQIVFAHFPQLTQFNYWHFSVGNEQQKKRKINELPLWNRYKNYEIWDDMHLSHGECTGTKCPFAYTRGLSKNRTKIVYIETSGGIILIEIDLSFHNFVFIVFDDDENEIIFHAYYNSTNNKTIDYAWKSGDFIKFIYNFQNQTIIEEICVYDLIPNILLWTLQKNHFLVLQNFLSIKYSFASDLIYLLCEYLNPLL